MGGKVRAAFGWFLIGMAGIVTIAGVVGFQYILSGSDLGSSVPAEARAESKVRTLLELGPPLLIAVGVLLGVGVYCLASARRDTAASN